MRQAVISLHGGTTFAVTVERYVNASRTALLPIVAERPPTRPRPDRQRRSPLQSLRTLGMSAQGYLIGVLLAELVTALYDPFWGILAHLLVLLVLLCHAGLTTQPAARGFLISMAIAPLIRIVSLGMPLAYFDQQWWYLLSSIPLLAASALAIRSIGLRRAEIGLRLPRLRDWPLTVLVALSGLALGVMEYLILQPESIVQPPSAFGIARGALVLFVCTGFTEELIFRGLMQTTAGRLFGNARGIIYVSALFGVLHIGHLSLIDVFFVTAVAIYFALVVRRTGTLLGVTIAHGLTNSMLFIVLPLLRSPW